MDNIRALRDQGKTILLIEHNMDMVMNLGEKVIVMTNGRYLLEGVPDDIRKHPLVIEAYLGGKSA